jgi:hypothetical protein
MQPASGCAGNAPGYTHQAGDQFIFKGGVTWPAACFPMNIIAGGSSNTSRDTYTVDQAWFAGGGFAKPIFAGQNVSMDGMIYVSASNITLSYLDVGGWKVAAVNGNTADCDQATIIVNRGGSNITASYMYLHDWLVPVIPTLVGGSTQPVHGITSGGMCINQFGHFNIVLDHSEVSDAANTVGGSELAVGACGANIGIQYTHCHDLYEGIVNHDAIHDNEFNRIAWPCQGSPPSSCGADAFNNTVVHTNIIESSINEGDGPVYNNYIHDTGVFGEIIDECAQGVIYNNVITNTSRVAIRFQWCGGDSASSVAYVSNNTVDETNCVNRDGGCPWGAYEYSRSALGGNAAILKFQNNIAIGSGASLAPAGGSTVTPNYSMSASEAATYGFTPANKYKPSSSDPNVSGQGANLSSLCSGILGALCQDDSGTMWFGGSYIARATAWDLGAYAFGGQSSSGPSQPDPPTNLTATVQ